MKHKLLTKLAIKTAVLLLGYLAKKTDNNVDNEIVDTLKRLTGG